MGKDSFIIYSSFYKPISILSDKQLGRLTRAIFQYNLGEVVNVEDDIKMAFEFFKNQFEIDESKYRAKIERDIENGRKGGNPNIKRGKSNPYYTKGNKPGKITQDNPGLTQDNPGLTQDNPTQPKITLNENDNVNVIEKKISSNEDMKEKDFSFAPASDEYARFVEWMKEHAPYCYSNIKPITEKQLAALKKKYTSNQIADTILQIENRKDLRKRYESLYRTVLNWLKNDYGKDS